MTEPDKIQGQERLGPQPLLRDVLAELTFRPGRAIPSHVNSVNLGVFQDEARELANNCFLDPENKNSGKFIYVTGQKRVLVPVAVVQAHNPIVLPMVGAVSIVKKEIAEKERLNEPYLAMMMHSYGNTDLLFSPADLALLMLNDSQPGASVASLLAGRTQNTLFFRGQNAPQLNVEEAEEKSRAWAWQLEERIRQFVKPEMTEEEVLDIVSRAERTLLRQICDKYDLKFFSGSTDQVVVTKQSL